MPRGLNLSRLPHLAPPVLSAYLDINPANPRNQGTPRRYVTWLASAGQAMGNRLTPGARRLFRTQLARIDHYLRTGRPRGRSLVVFAGPDVWQTIPLQVDVAEELHWGKPSLKQMLWVLDEHRPRGVIVVDGSEARFFHLCLGTITEDKTASVTADDSRGRKKYLVGTSHPGVFKRHGIHRDRAKSRKAAQRGRFARELARRIARWSDEEGLSPVVLAGSGDVIDATVDELPTDLRKRIMIIRKAFPRISASQVQSRLGPALKRWERDYEASLVSALVAARGTGTAVIGLDETLAELQNGRARELIVARGITGSLRECVRCGRVDRSADPVCSVCGAGRRPRTLRTLIPELAAHHDVPVEIVAGAAAAKLRTAGSIGAWLRSRKTSARRATIALRARSAKTAARA